MKRILFTIVAFSIILTAWSQNAVFRPGGFWPDNLGNHINAHGGGILFHEGKYYWFGEHKGEGEQGNTALTGVSCYTSEDLHHWTYEGIALKVDDDPTSEITKGCILERPKVIYNARTKKFVMWFHLELKGSSYASARSGVAVSDKPTGPFKYLKSYRPNANTWPANFKKEWQAKTANEDSLKWWTDEWRVAIEKGLMVRRDFKEGQMSRDMTLFVDDDGKAYHIHAAEENLTLHFSALSDDYLSFTNKWITFMPGGHNEAPAIVKTNGKYYLITSGCTGWEPNAARSFVATSIWGPWTSLGNPAQGKNAERTFESQSTFILPVQGKKNSFIFMADRWVPDNPIDGKYVWLPLTFIDGKPVIKWHDEWSLDQMDEL
jgi:beta-xylosidase